MKTIQRAYKTELDPTPEQVQRFVRFAGSCRWVYNWGLARKQEAYAKRKAIIERELARMDETDGPAPSEKVAKARKDAAKKIAFGEVAMPGAQSGNNQALTVMKREECLWLYETANECLQNALRNLDCAYGHFYRRWSEGKKGKDLGFPRYKTRKKGLGGFRFNQAGVRVFEDQIKLPVIGLVRLKERGYLPLTQVAAKSSETKNACGGHVRLSQCSAVSGEAGSREVDLGYLPQSAQRVFSATVTEQAGRWFVSLQVEVLLPDPEPNTEVVGIDLGCNHMATLSDGTVYENPKPLRRYLKKLKRAQRALSRKQKGSANRQKARRRVAKVHQRIAQIRQNALHQTTTAITKRYGVVVMEDLNVRGMVKNRRLARTISDVGMYEFKRQMAYKLDWRGGTLILANRFFPSSKNCSGCGAYRAELSLAERTYHCGGCGLVLDRDLNAARNLAALATVLGANSAAGKSPEALNACGGRVRLDLGSAVSVETGTYANGVVS